MTARVGLLVTVTLTAAAGLLLAPLAGAARAGQGEPIRAADRCPQGSQGAAVRRMYPELAPGQSWRLPPIPAGVFPEQGSWVVGVYDPAVTRADLCADWTGQNGGTVNRLKVYAARTSSGGNADPAGVVEGPAVVWAVSLEGETLTTAPEYGGLTYTESAAVASPSPATSPAPSPATSPAPATSVAPSPATSAAPSPATSAPPSPPASTPAPADSPAAPSSPAPTATPPAAPTEAQAGQVVVGLVAVGLAFVGVELGLGWMGDGARSYDDDPAE